jgi:hypothetical protein
VDLRGTVESRGRRHRVPQDRADRARGRRDVLEQLGERVAERAVSPAAPTTVSVAKTRSSTVLRRRMRCCCCVRTVICSSDKFDDNGTSTGGPRGTACWSVVPFGTPPMAGRLPRRGRYLGGTVIRATLPPGVASPVQLREPRLWPAPPATLRPSRARHSDPPCAATAGRRPRGSSRGLRARASSRSMPHVSTRPLGPRTCQQVSNRSRRGHGMRPRRHAFLPRAHRRAASSCAIYTIDLSLAR